MKILGINGSPRIGGNSDILLEKAMEGAVSLGAETEKICIEKMDISPCREEEYGKVNEEGLSVVEDDMRIIFRKISEADAVIVVSPVFFGSISAQLKAMIDRFQCVWISKNILKKEVFTKKMPGGFICVSASDKKDYFENSRSIVRHFFATINIDCREEIFCPGIDAKGSVSEHPELLERAYKLGRRIANGKE